METVEKSVLVGRISCLFVMLVMVSFTSTALADWEAPQWVQLPDLTTYGMDIRVDDYDGIERALADDFLCYEPSLITEVHFWGSWNNDIKGNITNIHLSIYDDITALASPTGYSTPGTLEWEMDFGPTQFIERHSSNISPSWESWWDPYEDVLIEQGDQNVWQYNIAIDQAAAFFQEGTSEVPKVYWLEILVETDGTGEFGWKTSTQHWNGNAVLDDIGWEEMVYPYSVPAWQGDDVDMSFVIIQDPVIIPEPATVALFGMGGLLAFGRRKKIQAK